MSTTSSLMRVMLALTLAIVAMQPGSADESPSTPKEKPVRVPNTAPTSAMIAVKMDPKATETHIQISPKALARLMDAHENAVKKDTGFLTTPDHTIVAGLAMTVALVLGGLYQFRKGSRKMLRPALIIAVAGVAFASSFALADRAPSKPAHVSGQNATLTAVETDTVGFTVDSKVLVDLKFKRASGEK